MAKKQLGQGANRFAPQSQFGDIIEKAKAEKVEAPKKEAAKTMPVKQTSEKNDQDLTRSGSIRIKRNTGWNKQKLKQTSFLIDKELSDEIKIFSVKNNTSASALVNQILKNYFEKSESW